MPSQRRIRPTVAASLLVSSFVRAASPPNFILIVADDLGFSDPGYMGGEIRTPHLDALAADGVRFTRVYNAARCCPTRAALLTGLHPHQTGIGWMTTASEESPRSEEPPAYQGWLNHRCVTIAEVLREGGYATFMAGKWHLGKHDPALWPLQRGFERFYGCLDGALRYFYPEHPRGITLDNEPVDRPESTTDREFYTTDAFTDWAIRFLRDEASGARRPFFLYLAYTAPHWPLQAFEDDIANYRDTYRVGWDRIREERWRRQRALGLWPPGVRLPPRPSEIPAWDSLDAEQQDEMALKMAVYAAMVDRMDWNIGRLVACLREIGVFENTVIMFMSDNGACAEGGMLGRGEFRDPARRNREGANAYGEAWAWACNTPLRLYKHYLHEGGAASPFFLHWPAGIRPRADWCREPASVLDILPTLLDLAGVSYPRERDGVPLPSPDGVSLKPCLEGRPLPRAVPIAFEHEGNAALYDGEWKLVGRDLVGPASLASDRWELYRMSEDPTETRDLARAEPARLQTMQAAWMAWARRVGVWPKGDRGPLPERVSEPPRIAGRGVRVTAEIESDSPRGVVLSHGGSNLGWAVWFDANAHPCVSLRHRGQLIELRGAEPVRGRVTLRAEITATALTFRVGDRPPLVASSPGWLPEEPGLGLFLGASGPHPVGSYAPPFRFRGWIHSWNVETDGLPNPMRTPWGEVVPEVPWPEHPRPQLRRAPWWTLNGIWDFAVRPRAPTNRPAAWEGHIRVPFAIESALSGVGRRFTPRDQLWYRRIFEFEPRAGRRYRLNFEAVDYRAEVWLNGVRLGAHIGGWLPFSFDATAAIRRGTNELVVAVEDATDAPGRYQLHGKQRLQPRGIWYTAVSGIWQPVWIEETPPVHIEHLRVSTHLDGTVRIETRLAGGTVERIRAAVRHAGREVARAEGPPPVLEVRVSDPQLWSPESPTLYDLVIEAGEDRVESYTGIREVSRIRDADGHWRFALNGRPIFHWGTLDQGWWPDGLLTPPSDEAMLFDIEFLKAAGFNTIRKHIKIEPRRYYWHCDRLGMLVWQDLPSHMDTWAQPKWTRLDPDPVDAVWPDGAHRQFMAELGGMIEHLESHPSVTVWVPFNEAWGQHSTLEVGRWTVDRDPTRLVNVASGGNWWPVGHIVDEHRYPHPGFPFELGGGGRFDAYIKVIGEFGGHGFPVEGHMWDPRGRNWGYGGLPRSAAEWKKRYVTSIRMLADLQRRGIAAGMYTQTTDVEGELNGLLTYDRRVRKMSTDELREIHSVLWTE